MVKIGEPDVHADGLPLKIFIFVAPFLIIAALMYLKEFDHKLYRTVVKEDGLVEYLTCINYFIAFVVGLVIANNFRKQKIKFLFVLYLLFSLCLLFAAGEEISWGQRLFKIRPPDFFLENSIQYEFNLHNLKQIHDLNNRIFILIGLFGSMFWLLLLCLKPLGLDKLQKICVPYLTPQWFLAGYFLPAAIYFYYIEYLFPQFRVLSIRFKEQEPVEFVLSLGFLLFAILNRIHQASNSGISKPKG